MLSRIINYRATTLSILEIPIVGLIILLVYPDTWYNNCCVTGSNQQIKPVSCQQKVKSKYWCPKVTPLREETQCPTPNQSDMKETENRYPYHKQLSRTKLDVLSKTKTDTVVSNCDLMMVVIFRSVYSPKK